MLFEGLVTEVVITGDVGSLKMLCQTVLFPSEQELANFFLRRAGK